VSKFHGWSSLRLDGSLPGDKRQKLIDIFNNPKYNYFILFLSTKAGGVGLNLTGANRLILLEPDWNPAVDIQVDFIHIYYFSYNSI
jgi:DNA repair and recombination RAD54-like protein